MSLKKIEKRVNVTTHHYAGWLANKNTQGHDESSYGFIFTSIHSKSGMEFLLHSSYTKYF